MYYRKSPNSLGGIWWPTQRPNLSLQQAFLQSKRFTAWRPALTRLATSSTRCVCCLIGTSRSTSLLQARGNLVHPRGHHWLLQTGPEHRQSRHGQRDAVVSRMASLRNLTGLAVCTPNPFGTCLLLTIIR
ncbi:hypothetical protein GGI42DRAFT_249912 [Trichoderma sp. SZMC 28013]